MNMRRRRTDGARILVVEDHDDFRALLELTLTDAGYQVDCAASSEDALAMLKAAPYKLLLADYSLPGHSGAWLLAQAAGMHGPRNVPSLMVTGDADAPGIPRNIAVMRKPIDVDRLLSEVRSLIGAASPVPRARVPPDAHEPLRRMMPPAQIPTSGHEAGSR